MSSSLWNEYFAGNHDAVLRAGADAAETLHISGLSLVAMGRFDEAETLLGAANHCGPNPNWFANGMVAFLDAAEPERAGRIANLAIDLFPDDPAILYMVGNVLTASERSDEAIPHFIKALSIDPEHWEAGMNLGNAYRRNGRYEDAIRSYENILPKITDVQGKINANLNAAVTLTDMGRYTEALMVFERLSAIPHIHSAEMDFNRATIMIRLGNFIEGWKAYLRRWDCQMAQPARDAFLKPMALTLDEVRGKRVLFSHEQGYGDSIQFVRYAPMLAEIADVTILCPEPLVKLFECFGLPVVTSRDGLDYDLECPMLNAPMLFETELETIPNSNYLSIPPEIVEQAKLPDNGRLKVGIIWAGQKRPVPEMAAMDERRSISNVQEVFKGISALDIDLYSLQIGDRAGELSSATPLSIFDFQQSGAAMLNLDLVISVDTAGAHLAGALGVPVMMLSRFDGCWRWLEYSRTDSPWYPSMTIYRQKFQESWEEVVARLESDIRLKLS